MNLEIAENHTMFTQLRHDIHRHPELGFKELKTSQMIVEKLTEWGFDEVHSGIAQTGVVGVLKGMGSSSKSIGLRADMDALSMDEENTFAHKSCHSGVMHGCGHDGHTAMLLASAWYLSKYRNFSGTVNFIFQPAEEGLGGAKVMIDEGLFERFPCDRIYGMHNMPGIPEGEFHLREGALLASSDRFNIIIEGVGGHAAMPERVVDPAIIMSNIVLAAQSIVSRNVSPLESAVISITDLHCGSGTYNVIASTAIMMGCVRAFDEKVRKRVIERLTTVVEQTAIAHGATATLRIQKGGYPATVNHKEATRIAAEVAEKVVGEDKVNKNCTPLGGSEDFSYMLQQVPGCYLLLGNGSTGEKGGVSVHNPSYDFNDEIIPQGASFFIELVKSELSLVTS
ncbi:M20 family metallopeptidase [Vibrio kyushuensis]|uniref:M20 aminoacylase family protein n=1 Tax=Vibrio kyushuensis TaxID=2910249 RepID=UPI003D11D28D